MHIVVSWDIVEPASQNWDDWNNRLKAAISTYSWVRPLRTVYVIAIPNVETRLAINSALTIIANGAPQGSVHFIVSPIMVGGQYSGVLPQNLWAELNKRSA